MSDIVDTESGFDTIETIDILAPSHVPLSWLSRIEAESILDQGTADPWESIDSIPWPAPLLEEPVGVEQAYEWLQRSEWSDNDITTCCAPLPWSSSVELEAEPTLDQGTVDPRESTPWPAPLLGEVDVERVYRWPQELTKESELPQDPQLPHEVPQDLDCESLKLPTTQVKAPRKVEPVITSKKCRDCNASHTEKWARCKVCTARRYFDRLEERRQAQEQRSAEIGRKDA